MGLSIEFHYLPVVAPQIPIAGGLNGKRSHCPFWQRCLFGMYWRAVSQRYGPTRGPLR